MNQYISEITSRKTEAMKLDVILQRVKKEEHTVSLVSQVFHMQNILLIHTYILEVILFYQMTHRNEAWQLKQMTKYY